MYLKSITAGAVDITGYCLQDATEISLSSGGRMATARLAAQASPLTSPPPPIPSAQDALVITGNVHADCSQCAENGGFENGLTGWDLFNSVVTGDGLNLLLWSEDFSKSTWALDGTIAPTKTGTNQINFGAHENSRVLQAVNDQTPLNLKKFTLTMRARSVSGTQYVRLRILHDGVTLHLSADFTLTTTSADFTYTATFTDFPGSGNMSAAANNGTDGAARSVIIERIQFTQSAAAVTYEKSTATRPLCARIPSNQGAQAGPNQTYRCDPYQSVTVTAQVRPNSNGTHYQVIQFKDASGAALQTNFSTAITPGSAWAEASYTRTAPAQTYEVTVYPAFLDADATTGEFDVDDVAVAVADRTIFRGTITRVEPQIVTPSQVRYTLAAQDNTRILDTIVVALEEYTAQTDEAILDDLMSTYSGSPPAITTTNVISVATLDTILFEALTLRQCIERIAERTGAEWYVDFDGDLHYFQLGQVDGVFSFSDAAVGNAETFPLISGFGYQEEFSSPANNVTVNGYHEPQGPDAATTIAIAHVNDDQIIVYTHSAWPPGAGSGSVVAGSDPNVLFYRDIGGTFAFSQLFLRFDTSAIPDDATVLSASLQIHARRGATAGADTSLMRIGGEYYAWNPSTIAITDYDDPGGLTFDAVPPTSVGPLNEAYGVLTLPLLGVSNISKTGYTGFRLFADKNGGIIPVADNSIEIIAREASSSQQPSLTVTYRPARAAQIVGSYEDAVSVALYGEFQRTVDDSNVKSIGEAEARAETETVLFGYPIKSINVTFDRDGLYVGDTVSFTSSLLDIDDNFVVKGLRLRWPGGPELTRYSAELGQFRPDLIDFLRRRA